MEHDALHRSCTCKRGGGICICQERQLCVKTSNCGSRQARKRAVCQARILDVRMAIVSQESQLLHNFKTGRCMSMPRKEVVSHDSYHIFQESKLHANTGSWMSRKATKEVVKILLRYKINHYYKLVHEKLVNIKNSKTYTCN